MPVPISLTDDHMLDTGTPPDPVIARAEAAAERGNRPEAIALCLQTIATARLPVITAANLVRILQDADAPEAAALEADLVAQVRSRAALTPDDSRAQFNLGRLLTGFKRYDEAAEVFVAALPGDPLNLPVLRTLAAILLKQGKPDAAIALWQPAFAADPLNGRLRFYLAQNLAYHGFLDQARAMLDLAEPLFRDNRHEFAVVANAIRGTSSASSQAALTMELFDRRARTYDADLAVIGNRGPLIVGQVLDAMALPQARKLAVLDAGCGTGLCGALLRPYARSLHGIDLSAGMLAQAKQKRQYDKLTRSDLASPGTLPAGPFDLIVSSDVLVYFGDLGPVLRNLAAILRPGGWLVLTLELAEGPGSWLLHPSGRYRHGQAYVKSALQAAGLSTPKVQFDSHLRFEFGEPVRGLAVAAQRLALAFGAPGR